MNLAQLEHIIRAASTIADDDELIVIGSQAVLATYPEAPPELLISNEADLYPKNHPERWDLIDGSIGEGSPFHETYGYYAQGVDETTATLPMGWQSRLKPVQSENTKGAIGYCLDFHDLAIAKYVAGRPKDRRYLRAAIDHGLLDRATVIDRLSRTDLAAELRGRIEKTIQADFSRTPSRETKSR